MPNGTLFLLPCYLGENSSVKIFSEYQKQIISKLTYFVVENEKSARKFLKFIFPEVNQQELQIEILNKNTNETALEKIIQPLLDGNNIGLLSEAGLPCIADPGNILVQFCHERNIEVKPISGPTSIILALISSGLNGQKFTFHGYLPIDKLQVKVFIKEIERKSVQQNSAEIFMETPYRNNQLLEIILQTCAPQTLLCIATNITLSNEKIKTKTIANWKSKIPDLHKKPTIFILQSY